MATQRNRVSATSQFKLKALRLLAFVRICWGHSTRLETDICLRLDTCCPIDMIC